MKPRQMQKNERTQLTKHFKVTRCLWNFLRLSLWSAHW